MSDLNKPPTCTPRNYKVVVEGKIDESWSDWLNGIQLEVEKDASGMLLTVLHGSLPDQAALRGLLNRLWDLNLVLCSVQQVGPTENSEKK